MVARLWAPGSGARTSTDVVHRLALCCALIAAAAGAFAPTAARADAPVIAAASDLQFALVEIAEAFEAETGEPVELTFGSSGNFARQIRQGAPYQMYLSADERFVLDLHADGFTRDDGVLYALGRIVIFTPHGSPLASRRPARRPRRGARPRGG
jgi:molybdate transport system substrate-binding protein